MRFGKVVSIIIKAKGIAYILYSNNLSAAFALNFLDEHKIEKLFIQLSVSWAKAEEYNELMDEFLLNINDENQKEN